MAVGRKRKGKRGAAGRRRAEEGVQAGRGKGGEGRRLRAACVRRRVFISTARIWRGERRRRGRESK
jgi:hypothetical protein